jgi:hypothetical protein
MSKIALVIAFILVLVYLVVMIVGFSLSIRALDAELSSSKATQCTSDIDCYEKYPELGAPF